MVTTMNEARAKFVKQCDADSIKEIKKIMSAGSSPAIPTMTLVLDKICQFITKNAEASYRSEGAAIFANAEVFSSAAKRADPSFHEKQWISDVASQVNMDMEGAKGKLLNAVSDPASANFMYHIFPYFKLVFKYAQIGMTLKSMQSLSRKQEKAQKELDDV